MNNNPTGINQYTKGRTKGRGRGSFASSALGMSGTPLLTKATFSLATMKSLTKSPRSVKHGVGFGKKVAISNAFGKGEAKTVGLSTLKFKTGRGKKK